MIHPINHLTDLANNRISITYFHEYTKLGLFYITNN